jgi:hypothetical protein
MIVLGHPRLERSYKGYLIEGSAEPVGPGTNLLLTTATVLLKRPDASLLRVNHFRDRLLTYEDADLAAWFGLGIAEISVDRCLPPPWHYLVPMDVARAVEILRRGAEDHHKREIRKPELYEALAFLEQYLDEKSWLVRRYGYTLRGDTRNQREKMQQRENLRVRFRGIQRACIDAILSKMNELAIEYRKNRPAINELRRQLALVSRRIGK